MAAWSSWWSLSLKRGSWCLEFLVEPVPKEGFLVPQAEWGRAAMLYSMPRT